MKVFALQGDVYRLARLAWRQVPDAALARFELLRRGTGCAPELSRWRLSMPNELSSEAPK